jgi:hypothetical protein
MTQTEMMEPRSGRPKGTRDARPRRPRIYQPSRGFDGLARLMRTATRSGFELDDMKVDKSGRITLVLQGTATRKNVDEQKAEIA